MMEKISNSNVGVRLCLALAMLGLASLKAGAQDSVSQYDHGTPPQHQAGISAIGSYMSAELGTVNLSNGSLNFKIPMGSVGGRGFLLPLTLNYTNKVWSARTGKTPVFDPTPSQKPVAWAVYDDAAQAEDKYYKVGPGWTVGAAPFIKVRGVGIDSHNNPSNGCTDFTWVLVKLTVVLPDKGEIELRDDQLDGAPVSASVFPGGCRTQDGYRGRRWHATDGSGAVFYSTNDNGVVNGDVAGVLITADGTWYHFKNANVGNVSGSAYLNNLGRCNSVTDRNGNQVLITYAPNKVIYTDQLGRQTTLEINDPALAPIVLRVTLPGYNGAQRVYTVTGDTMNLHYRADNFTTLPVINGDFDPLGYGYEWPASHISLYGTSYGSNAERIDNRPVVSQITLPDGRALTFNYNQFGEVAEVQMPTGGKVQYDYQSVPLNTATGVGLPTGNSLNCEVHPISTVPSNVKEVDRAVTARRTYPDGSNLEGTWTYSYKATDTNGVANGSTEVKCTSAGTLLMDQWHYYMNAQRFLTQINDAPDGTGYSLWSTGLERRSEMRDTNGTTILSANEQDWTQRASVVWTGGYSAQQIANDNRINQQRNYLDDGSFAKVITSYDPITATQNHVNNPTDVSEYDFDQTLKRRTATTYLTGGRYTGTGVNTVNILSLPVQQSVYDGPTGTELARTTYEYDNYTPDGQNNHAALVDNGTVTAHDSDYTTSFIERGNLTQVGRLVSGAALIFSYPRYDTLGNVISTKDPRGFVSTISYLDDFGNGSNPGAGASGSFGFTFALPTLVTSPPPNPGQPAHTARSQYDFNTGLMTGFKDRNGVIAQTIYNDPFDRPTQIKTALGANGVERHVAMYYAGLNPVTVFGVTLIKNDVLTAGDQTSIDDGNLRSWTRTDGFGRTVDAFTRDPQGDVLSTTTYDGLGRAKRATNPYRAISDPTYGYTDTTYDLLGRLRRVETFNGQNVSTGAVKTDYSGSRVLVTDQAGKQRISKTNGIGQLSDVWEVTASDGATEAVTFPGHSEVTAAYRTIYTYDGLGNLTQVNQGSQVRQFTYDRLSRLLTAKNPEQVSPSGQMVPTIYDYDQASNLITRTNPNLTTVGFTYDGLNRVKTKTLNVGGTFTYVYDTATNGKGRLRSVTSSDGDGCFYDSYDLAGQVAASHQVTTAGGQQRSYAMSYGYNLVGAMTKEVYPSLKEVRTSYDSAARVSQVSRYIGSTLDKTYASAFSYTPHGAVSALTLAGGKMTEQTIYNTRLQPTQMDLRNASTTEILLGLDYGFAATTNNGNMLSQKVRIGGTTPSNPTTTFNQSFTYDALNRLDTATETNGWFQNYDYDRFGNRWVFQSTVFTPDPTLCPRTGNDISKVTNRILMSGFSYDVSGNQKTQTRNGQNEVYDYDSENRLLSVTVGSQQTGSYVYDGDGRRVKKTDLMTGTTVFVYNAGGQLIAEYTSGPAQPNGTSYLTTDHLGSTRLVTSINASGNVVVKARHDYLPFGEEIPSTIGRGSVAGYASSDSTRQRFTQKERDVESGLDFFLARYYSSAQGRFTSPDEFVGGPNELYYFANAASANPTFYADLYEPQSLNKYQYGYNNPLRYVDPDGHGPGDDPNNKSQVRMGPAAETAFKVGLGTLLCGPLCGAVLLLAEPPRAGAPTDDNMDVGQTPTPHELWESSKEGAAVLPPARGGLGKIGGREEGSKGGIKEITISAREHPEAAEHAANAQAAGKPSELTVGDPSGKNARRAEAMKGHPRVAGKDRDEYPPAWSKEGGKGASVRAINPHDNRGSGASMGWQIRGVVPGTKVKFKIDIF